MRLYRYTAKPESPPSAHASKQEKSLPALLTDSTEISKERDRIGRASDRIQQMILSNLQILPFFVTKNLQVIMGYNYWAFKIIVFWNNAFLSCGSRSQTTWKTGFSLFQAPAVWYSSWFSFSLPWNHLTLLLFLAYSTQPHTKDWWRHFKMKGRWLENKEREWERETESVLRYDQRSASHKLRWSLYHASLGKGSGTMCN